MQETDDKFLIEPKDKCCGGNCHCQPVETFNKPLKPTPLYTYSYKPVQPVKKLDKDAADDMADFLSCVAIFGLIIIVILIMSLI